MKKICGFSFIVLLAAACTRGPAPASAPSADSPAASPAQREAAAPPPAVQSLRGMYRAVSGGPTFYDCTSAKNYRVTEAPTTLDSLYREACAPAPYAGETVFAVLQGRINTAEGTLAIDRVETVAAKNRNNTCLPYDFWCIGTEPFWRLLISEQEGGLFLKLIGEEQGRSFPWVAAQTGAGAWTYTSTNPATQQTLKVIIRKETCTDGMSDQSYDYSAELHLGKQTLRGCAMRQHSGSGAVE